MKKAIAILLIISVFPLCGCWDRREIGDLPIVMGFGVDKSKEPGKISITSQIANPSTSTSSSGEKGSSSPEPFFTITEDGESVFSTVRQSALIAGKKLYISHNQVVVLGEDIAREGISDYIDWFSRDHELRFQMYILIADGTAKKILETPADFEEVPAMHIANIIRAQEDTSTGPIINILDVLDALASKKKSVVIPIIKVDNDTLKLSGLAVFNNDKMVGKLTNEEGMGLLWGTNNFKSSVIVTVAENSRVGIEILNSESKITPNKDGSFDINLDIKANLASEHGSFDFTDSDGIVALQKALSKKVETDIRNTLKRSSELNCDIFGFSEMYYKKYPRQWEDHKNEFTNPKININVTTQILISGRIQTPIH